MDLFGVAEVVAFHDGGLRNPKTPCRCVCLCAFNQFFALLLTFLYDCICLFVWFACLNPFDFSYELLSFGEVKNGFKVGAGMGYTMPLAFKGTSFFSMLLGVFVANA